MKKIKMKNKEKKEEKSTVKKNSIKDMAKQTAFGVAKERLLKIYEKNSTMVYGFVAGSVLLADFISGSMAQMELLYDRKITEYSFFASFYYGIAHYGILTLVLTGLMLLLGIRLIGLIYNDKIIDREREIETTTNGTCGTALPMDAEEKRETFDISLAFQENFDILGADVENPLMTYGIKKVYGINGNELWVGAPGAGKSRAAVINKILQLIRRGESGLVTDSKSVLHGTLKVVAEAHGYVVKQLNLDLELLRHSDTCDFLKPIVDDDLKAIGFAQTIMENTSGEGEVEKKEFWTTSELNALTMTCFLIANHGERLGMEQTLGGVFKYINEHSVEELDAVFGVLPEDDPSYVYYQNFCNDSEKVQEDTWGGLKKRLSILGNPVIQKITGEDDMDFTLPGRQKCLYFLNLSDQDTSTQFLSALYIDLFTSQNVRFADKQPGKRLPIPIKIIFEEFANVGRVSNWERKMATMRSRGIDVMMILQGIEQLITLYPNDKWQTVVNCCSTQVLLRTNNKINMEYFSFMTGEGTVKNISTRVTEKKGEILHLHPEVQITESNTKRMRYTPDETRRLKGDRMLLIPSGHNVIELLKIDYSRHPMCKEIRYIESTRYCPPWVKELNAEGRRKYRIKKEDFDWEEPEYNIEFCTEEDFKEYWTKEKEEALQKSLQNKGAAAAYRRPAGSGMGEMGDDVPEWLSGNDLSELESMGFLEEVQAMQQMEKDLGEQIKRIRSGQAAEEKVAKSWNEDEYYRNLRKGKIKSENRLSKGEEQEEVMRAYSSMREKNEKAAEIRRRFTGIDNDMDDLDL